MKSQIVVLNCVNQLISIAFLRSQSYRLEILICPYSPYLLAVANSSIIFITMRPEDVLKRSYIQGSLVATSSFESHAYNKAQPDIKL